MLSCVDKFPRDVTELKMVEAVLKEADDIEDDDEDIRDAAQRLRDELKW